MSKTKQFGLCLLFFLLVRRPEPVAVSQPVETFKDSMHLTAAAASDAKLPAMMPKEK